MVRGLLDRAFVALAFVVLRGFFRRVEVEGRDRIPTDRPILVVANHFNGFVDPVILVHVFGRVPRFLAKATLWRRRWMRPLLALAGMLPVYRRQDADARAEGDHSPNGRDDNRAAFRRGHQVLGRRRGLVAIFPEGVTHDVPSLARIRTGAARLALGARANGVSGLTVVPVGMAFDDKLALRSRALARVGEPLDLDSWAGSLEATGEPATEEAQSSVQRLTESIEARLRAVSPDYRDLREAKGLARAAEITARTTRRGGRVSLAEQERLSQRLAHAPRRAVDEVMQALARYHLDLVLSGLRDHQLIPGYTPRQLLTGVITTGVLVGVLAPVLLVGVLVNILPYLCVRAAGLAVEKPVMKGTARFLVALVAFPLTWAATVVVVDQPPLAGNLLPDNALATLALLAFLPLAGLVAVVCIERLERARRAWHGWLALRERRALLGDVLANRSQLVATVEAAVGEAPAPGPTDPPAPGAGRSPSVRG